MESASHYIFMEYLHRFRCTLGTGTFEYKYRDTDSIGKNLIAP